MLDGMTKGFFAENGHLIGFMQPLEVEQAIDGVVKVSKRWPSLKALWDSLPKLSSGEVAAEEVWAGAGFDNDIADEPEENGKISWTEANDYVHAIIEIAGESGRADPNAICEW